jgi:hypothetical protein
LERRQKTVGLGDVVLTHDNQALRVGCHVHRITRHRCLINVWRGPHGVQFYGAPSYGGDVGHH